MCNCKRTAKFPSNRKKYLLYVFNEYGNFDATIDVVRLGYWFVVCDLMLLVITFIVSFVLILFMTSVYWFSVGVIGNTTIRIRFQANVGSVFNSPVCSYFGIKFDGLAFGRNYLQIRMSIFVCPQFNTPNL